MTLAARIPDYDLEPDLIRELCISLFGQWEPDRLFMIFFARIDESDTHGRKPDITMSAMLGSGQQWERLRRGLKAVQRDYGFTVFHGTEFRSLSGEFSGWSGPKCVELLYDVGKLVSGTMTESVTVTSDYQTYHDHFLLKRPRKMHQTSQYGLCFTAIMDAVTVRVAKLGPRHRLSVIVEDGHPNAPDTARIFRERKKAYSDQGMDFYRTHTLASKEDDPLLMLADMTAYGSALEARAERAGAPRPFTDSPGASEPRRTQTGWTVAKVTPQYIANVISEFEAGKAAKHENWLKRRAEWLVSQERFS